MKFTEFEACIHKFECVASEYMPTVKTEFTQGTLDGDGTDHTARLIMQMPYGSAERIVHLCVDPDDENAVAISVSPDGDVCGHLDADTGGLYTFLWHAAESELAREIKKAQAHNNQMTAQARAQEQLNKKRGQHL